MSAFVDAVRRLLNIAPHVCILCGVFIPHDHIAMCGPCITEKQR